MSFDLVTFHREAVETPSNEDVTAMRELLLETLEDERADPEVDEAGNVLATRGTAGAPHLVLNTHIDTVSPHVPYEREGDRVHGRGACDAKGPLASLVDAFLSSDPGDGRLTLAITPDEETIQTGAAHLRETLDADAYVVGEPTGLDVCTAARGQFEGTVTVHGTSAHAATPESGANAIVAAAPIIEALESFDEAVGTPTHDVLGAPTLTPTRIEGGEASNQVPAHCTITFDRRSVPPEASEDIPGDIETYLRELLPEEFELSVELTPRETPILEAFATDEDAPIVRALADASGGEVRPFGAATEASYLAERAPTVVFGPGVLADDEGPVAHSDREYVDLPDVEDAAEALRTAIGDFL